MHTTIFTLGLTALIHTSSCTHHNIRQDPSPTPTPTDPFSGLAADLISRYIPPSVTSLMYAHYTSYASTTGDPASVIESAFTALTPPAWLDTLPTEYQSNVAALEDAISVLRDEVSGNAAGATSADATAPRSAGNGDGSGAISLTASGATASRVLSEISEISSVTGSPTTSSLHGVLTPVKETPSIDWGPTESSESPGLARATGVPLDAVGIIGVIGVALVI